MFQKFFQRVVKVLKEEYKFFLTLLVFYIVFTFPVNYYIVTGGGISDIDSRITVEDANKSKGGFYISYVTELQGRVSTYLLSFLMKDWKRISMDDYKYASEEKFEDIEFRSDLDLEAANSWAIYYAYHLAGKKCEVANTKIYVTSILADYPTKLKIKDEIIKINDKSFSNIEDYRNYLQTLPAGREVSIVVKRNKKEKEIRTPLYQTEQTKLLGITLQQVTTYKTSPKVKIQFRKSESGPSGGLMTTLDIYNKLTKKDLTNSLKIAGTGTIEADGTIGEIGEIQYKLLGAEKEKADIFLAPAGSNYKTCQKLKKEKKLKIQIIEVKNIEDAINQLKTLKNK